MFKLQLLRQVLKDLEALHFNVMAPRHGYRPGKRLKSERRRIQMTMGRAPHLGKPACVDAQCSLCVVYHSVFSFCSFSWHDNSYAKIRRLYWCLLGNLRSTKEDLRSCTFVLKKSLRITELTSQPLELGYRYSKKSAYTSKF